jgi:uncharacterized membrane protein
MAPLIILLAAFGLLFVVNKSLLGGGLSFAFMGRASLALMLIATGIAHLTSTDAMIEMMPEAVPMKRGIVYLTGVLELLAVVGLLVDSLSRLTAVLLVVFFIVVLPANIAGSLKRVPLGGMENGPQYLFFRIPLQALFIFWAYVFGVRINRREASGTTRAISQKPSD